MERPKKPVFIVGCPRSGTTWLYHLLLSSGGFAIYRSESQVFDRLAHRFGRFVSRSDRSRFLDAWLDSEYFLRSGLDAGIFRRVVLDRVDSPGRLLNEFMTAICELQGATRWAECTPANALYLAEIKREFPDAVFIHIIRDGRDVALSLARQGYVKPLPWDHRSPEFAAAAYWAWIVRNVGRQSRPLGPDLMSVRYEDLILRFDDTLKDISRFIDKTLDPRRISAHSLGSVQMPNSSFATGMPASADAWKPRWPTMLSDPALRAIESAIGPDLTKAGYELSRGAPSSTAKLPYRLELGTYSLRFSMAMALKRIRLLNRLLPGHTRFDASAETDVSDPSMRPAQNIEFIREIVGN